ncbi:MAG: hypothetical protein AB9891_20045 [Anaerolineaceae bacterium]
MSRIINPDSAGKERTRLSRSVVLALREMAKKTEPDAESRDMAAFIGLALTEIHATIEISVAAWEKRDYWVKADRFRLDWDWSNNLGEAMKKAVLSDDWGTVALTAVKIAGKFMAIKIPERHHLGTPWVGAWKALQKEGK